MGRKSREGLIDVQAAEERIRQAAETHADALNLSNLGLAELPESLGHFAALRTLNLSGNRLSALPAWLGQLTALQYLELNFNQLSALPESLGQLTALESLFLFGNKLTALPKFRPPDLTDPSLGVR